MPLYFATPAPGKVPDAASRGFESFMDHQLKIGMWGSGLQVAGNRGHSIHGIPVDGNGLAFDNYFFAGQGQINANVEGLALLVVAVRHLQLHAASDDALAEGFEFLSLCADPELYFVRVFDVAKCDLQWKSHGLLP
jgi:hypothetical protein